MENPGDLIQPGGSSSDGTRIQEEVGEDGERAQDEWTPDDEVELKEDQGEMVEDEEYEVGSENLEHEYYRYVHKSVKCFIPLI